MFIIQSRMKKSKKWSKSRKKFRKKSNLLKNSKNKTNFTRNKSKTTFIKVFCPWIPMSLRPLLIKLSWSIRTNCSKLKLKQISLYWKIGNIMPLRSCKAKRRNTGKISEKFSRRNHRLRRNFDKILKFQSKLWILINCKKRNRVANNKFKWKKVLETNPKKINQIKNHHKRMKISITK